MRVAVCISGFLRTWEHTKMNFKKYLCDGIEPDLFIHTFRENFYEYSGGENDVIYTDEEIKAMFDGFNVKKIIIENRAHTFEKSAIEGEKYRDKTGYSIQIPDSSEPNARSVDLGVRIIEQLRVIESANDLKKAYEQETGQLYDVVIKTRFDMFYFSAPNLNIIQDGVVYLATGCTGGYPPECVMFGTSKTIDIVSSRHRLLNCLISETNIPGGNCACGMIVPWCSVCAHASLRHVIDMYNLKIFDNHFQTALVQRSENKWHLPGFGTVTIEQMPKHFQDAFAAS